MKQHKPGCMANLKCLVYHADGICPGPYGICTCEESMTQPNCKCVCHENKLNKPYEHDTRCCVNMNGVVTQPNWEELKTEFNEKFDKEYPSVRSYTAGHLQDFVCDFWLAKLQKSIQQAREEVAKEVEKLRKENIYHHSLGCRGFSNQIYLNGDSLGGHCTCQPVLDKDYSEYNQALDDSLVQLKK